MPHLDASSLSIEAESLDFLRAVLGTSENGPAPRHAFDVPKAAPAQSLVMDGEINRPRRPAALAEAA